MTSLMLPGIGVKSVMVVASSDRNTIIKTTMVLNFISHNLKISVNIIKDFDRCQIIDVKALKM